MRVSGGFLATLDALIDFFAMHGDVFGRSDADAHLIAP